MSAPPPPNEPQRLALLRAFGVLDTPPEPELDAIAALAADICETPIALLTLVDAERQWFKSRVGLERCETPRGDSFCAYALHSTGVLVVPDALQDARFAGNPLVTAEPRIRFYAGAPLVAETGEVLGTLCVIDRRPRGLELRQLRALQTLSRSAMTLLERRYREAEQHRHAAAQLRASEAQYRLLFADNPVPMWVFDLETLRFVAVNAAAIAHYGYSEAEFLARTIFDIRPVEDAAALRRLLAENPHIGKHRALNRHLRKDGTLIEVEVSSDRITFAGRPARLVSLNDITERLRAEREAARANRALRMLSRCAEALIRASDEQALLREICQIATEIGGFRFAWVGYAESDERRSIRPQAHAGVEQGYLDEIRLGWDESQPGGRGPAGRTIRGGAPVIVSDVTDASSGFHYVTQALARGYRGIVCLPLKDENRTFGLLALYLGEARAVPPEELALLEELAGELAFGILNLRSRAERRRTHDAVLAMARGISAAAGVSFFEKLAVSLVEALGAHSGFIAQLNPKNPERARMLAAATATSVAPAREIMLPVEIATGLGAHDLWLVPRAALEAFPRVPVIDDRRIEAFAGALLADAAGRPIGVLFVHFTTPLLATQFVTSTLKIFAARAAAEIERQEADTKTREQAALLDKAQDAILVRDLEHRILYWNKSAERLYGWTAQEAIGRSVRSMLYPDPTVFDRAMVVLLTDGEWVGELQQIRKDGSPLTIEGHWTLVRDEAGQPRSVLAINTDVTERKRLEQQFLRAQRMESIGTLAGGIAHDLNNLLAPITMGVDLLRRFEPLPTRSQAILANIERSTARATDLVKQVLSFARGVEGARIPLNVKHIVREIESIAENTFPKNIAIETEVAPELALVVADPTHLHQVLLNLCVNARDAMPNGGRLLLAAQNASVDAAYAATNRSLKPGRYVRIQVTDTGCGIPRENLDRIFEPFFTTKDVGHGTGLGLSTVLGIVRSQGGAVNVYSEVGRGSTFSVYLPAQDGAAPTTAVPETAATLPRGAGQTVLVVDDEESIRDITRRTLETFGYTVLTAEDGAQAIDVYVRHRAQIALVLTDMMMPVMDGIALILALRRLDPELRIIAASGLNAKDNVARATGAGVRHFLPKPYSAETLLELVARVLATATPKPGSAT
jgi:PAS domain S-box-containing protein